MFCPTKSDANCDDDDVHDDDVHDDDDNDDSLRYVANRVFQIQSPKLVVLQLEFDVVAFNANPSL